MMLSDAANVANTIHRPRPPGSRRSSSMKVKQSQHSLDEQDENVSPIHHHYPATSAIETSEEEAHRNVVKMEKDLGLDLPSDLFAAVNASRANRHRSCDTNDILEMEDTLRHSLGSKYKRRSMGSTPMQMYERKAPAVEQMETLYQADDDCEEGCEENGILHQQSLDSEVESDISINTGYVGELPRDQLEQMLMQANQIIKERERDLGIAAALGDALLKKNMSLRNKHEGLMTRLSSISSFSQFNTTEEEEEEDSESPSIIIPRYTPPTTDSAHSESEIEDEGGTPMPTPKIGDYFDQPSNETASAPFNRQGLPTHSSWSGSDLLNQQQDSVYKSSAHDHFVPSIPPSPASSHQSDHGNRSLYSAETQKQLEMLSDQNEALLERLAHLQAEAEEAKRVGGRKLKKLDREIEGLRAELQTATERNMELERAQLEESKDSEGEIETSRKGWRRKGSPSQSSEDANTSERSIETILKATPEEAIVEESRPVEVQAPVEKSVVHKASVAAMSIRSESSMSVFTQGRVVSDSERALVAQLMAKIQELEETNACLARAGNEMNGRIGVFMVEGERIRDAYDAVEQSAVMEESQLMRDETEIFDVVQSVDSPMHSVTASPLARYRRRRAPGNRYAIEGRKTLRAALKSELSLRSRRDEYHAMGNYSSDGDSSAGPSPMKERMLRRPQRPRILITPSTEDLRGKAANDRDMEWQERSDSVDGVDQYQTMSTPLAHKIRNRKREHSRDQGPARHYDGSSCDNTPIRELRSLGAELGSFCDEASVDVQESSVQTVQQRLHLGGPLRLIDLQRSPSGASVHLRSRESVSSLRAASEAASDIADLARSEMSDVTVREADENYDENKQSMVSADQGGQQFAMIPFAKDEASLPIMTLGVDGTYMDDGEEETFLRGCLKNEEQTSEWSYKSIQKANNRPQLTWADDDDFGKPITEREAREVGLLESTPTNHSSIKSRGLLAWVQKKAVGKKVDKGKAKRVQRSCQIESREEVEERERLAELLRTKRVLALRSRVENGQIPLRTARDRGILEEINDPYLEEEINSRAIAYNIARQRKSNIKQLTAPPQPPLRRSSRDRVHQMDEERRNRLQRGNHQSMLTLRERYQPAAVKRRAKEFSLEAITWASTWAAFSVVMILAFFVTFGQGPKRVLNGHNGHKR